jgi:hypothetical protein
VDDGGFVLEASHFERSLAMPVAKIPGVKRLTSMFLTHTDMDRPEGIGVLEFSKINRPG